MTDTARTYTIAEAAKACGISTKAMRSRVDRGSLDVVPGSQPRRVTRASLVRAGLLHTTRGPVADADAQAYWAELLDRLEAQSGELGRLRAIEAETGAAARRLDQEQARSDELETELHAARARIRELEAREAPRRSWWRRGSAVSSSGSLLG